jgi:hypothetical protein
MAVDTVRMSRGGRTDVLSWLRLLTRPDAARMTWSGSLHVQAAPARERQVPSGALVERGADRGSVDVRRSGTTAAQSALRLCPRQSAALSRPLPQCRSDGHGFPKWRCSGAGACRSPHRPRTPDPSAQRTGAIPPAADIQAIRDSIARPLACVVLLRSVLVEAEPISVGTPSVSLANGSRMTYESQPICVVTA